MPRDRRRRSRLAMLVAVLTAAAFLASIGSAAGQDSCPPTANNPACTGQDRTADRAEPGDPKAEEPEGNAPAHRGAGEPSSTTEDGTGSTSDQREDGESPEESPSPAPPPPPDLGPRRILSSRIQPNGSGLDLRVVVNERQARGVDGGWTITIALDGIPGSVQVADLRPPSGSQTVARTRTGQLELDAPRRLFGVFGQTSGQRYAGRYVARGLLEFRADDEAPEGDPPSIIITLFQ